MADRRRSQQHAPQFLARSHPGSAAQWRRRLREAGIRTDVPIAAMTPQERRGLADLMGPAARPEGLAERSIGGSGSDGSGSVGSGSDGQNDTTHGSHASSASSNSPPASVPKPAVPSLASATAGAATAPFDPVAWSRHAIHLSLAQWEPWRLNPRNPDLEYQAHRRRLSAEIFVEPSEAPPPIPSRLPEAIAPYLTSADSDAASLWASCDAHQRRLLTLLVGLERSPLLRRIAGTLMGGGHRPGISVRLARRLAAFGSTTQQSAAPPLSVVTQTTIAGAEYWRLRPRDPGAPGATPAPARTSTSTPGRAAAPKKGRSRGGPPIEVGAPESLDTSEGVDVRGLATRVPAWSDEGPPLILSQDTKRSLEHLKIRWTHRGDVALGEGHQGSGVIALFVGRAGYGKRSAASRLATELGLELYSIHSGRLASRYIGETEQRISALFAGLADRKAAVLLESAQDLMGSRVSVDSANDRYANMTVNHLLTTVESWPGLCILTGSSINDFDAAMQRRVDVSARFDGAGEGWRAEVVHGLWGWLSKHLRPELIDALPAHAFDYLVAQDSLAPAELQKTLFDLAIDAHVHQKPIDVETIDARVNATLSAFGYAVQIHRKRRRNRRGGRLD